MFANKIIIAGGSGFLGQTLAHHFNARGSEVVVLTRRSSPLRAGRAVSWDGKRQGDWVAELEGASALINLSGCSVDCRYTKRNRRRILDSRILPTQALGEAVSSCANPPSVWLNASTATIYKDGRDVPNDEVHGLIGPTPKVKDTFSIEVAKAWEETFESVPTPSTRKVILRTAMVLGDGKNSVYPVLARLARFELGGTMGDGGQLVSWLHSTDFCRAVEHLIADANASGIYNVCAPTPITNRKMMATVRSALGIRWGLPTPRWLLELGAFFIRTETELILKSRNVIPLRLGSVGFEFQFATFEEAVADLAKVSHSVNESRRSMH